MKKLLTVTCLAGLLSVPSVVFAEASWYGSIRAGVATTPVDADADGTTDHSVTHVRDASSRWGVKGDSEVAEGLTAVYRFESKLDSTDGSQPGGRLSYVGLSGGFGSITVGQIWNAAYNSFGAVTDNSLIFGDAETGYRHGDAVSYAVSVGDISLQADVLMNGATDKSTDKIEVGATIGGLMESGSIAIAHRGTDTDITWDHDSDADTAAQATGTQKVTTNYIAGQYGIGGMIVYLGYAKSDTKNNTCASANTACVTKAESDTTFAGIRGSVGDTGVGYLFQLRDKSSESTNNASTPVTTKSKSTPWVFGMSRSLGGGASVHFEHGDPDSTEKSSTGVWLKVDF